MSEYRERLLGFLKSRGAGGASALFAGEPSPAPSSRPAADSDLRRRFARELVAVGGEAIDLAAVDDPEAAVRERLARIGGGGVAIDADPAWGRVGLAVDEIAREAGLDVERVDGSTSAAALRDTALGLTIADAAIAEIGAIAQCARPFRPRSLSLVPPRHVVFVPADRLLPGLEDLFDGLSSGAPWAGGVDGFAAYFTWITGPSRTADIEKTLTIGIHGPGELTVFLLASGVDR